MPFKATVNVERFDEASDWFLRRIVLTAEQAAGLTGRGATDGFWVGAGLELHQIQSVFDKIGRAIEKGEPFADWRKRVRDELRNDAHAETVFRNAIQRAYNAGRWEQMRQPDVLRFRPFWLFDATLDSRTSDICKLCAGTLLPADDPFWETHVPPLHHRCRSGIRNLRRTEAEKRGITPTAPDTAGVRPPGEWGLPPTAPGWKPDLNRVDSRLHSTALNKAEARKTKSVPPMKAAPKSKPGKGPEPTEHSYEFWLAHYRPQYGEAAKSIAWGRAAMEEGLDMSLADVALQLKKLDGTALGANTAGLRRTADLILGNNQSSPNLRGMGGEIEEERRVLAALAGHLKRIEARDKPLVFRGKLLNGTPEDHARFESTLRAIDVMSGRALKHPTRFKVGFSSERSWASTPGKEFLMPTAPTGADFDAIRAQGRANGTTAHEWMHPVENNGDLRKRADDFRRRRAKSQKLRRLKTLDPSADYGDHELALDDEFVDAYIGKVYDHDATEVTSMAVEHWFTVDRFDTMKADPDFALFGLGQLSGHDLTDRDDESSLNW